MKNLLPKLQEKFASEIKRYGITEVTKDAAGNVHVRSLDRITWELFESIKLELL